MFQIIVQVHGMGSSSAGAPVGSAIRRRFPDAKQVVASRSKGTVSFVTETRPDTDALREAVMSNREETIAYFRKKTAEL